MQCKGTAAGSGASRSLTRWQLLHRSVPPASTRLPAVTGAAEEPQLQRRIQELESLAHQAAGREFNVGSPQEVRGGFCGVVLWCGFALVWPGEFGLKVTTSWQLRR